MADTPTPEENAQTGQVPEGQVPEEKANAATAVDGEVKDKGEKKVKNVAIDRSDAANKEDIIKGENLFNPGDLGVLNEVSIALTIEIGRAQIKIRDLLNLTKGSVIELNKLAGDPVDIYANGKLISTGNIITANGKYCVRVTSISEKSKLGVESDGK